MSIPGPELPQAQAGIIDINVIVFSGGLIVRIPRYSNVSRYDSIVIKLNGNIKAIENIYDEEDLPKNFTFSDGYKTNALNDVYYTVITQSQNYKDSTHTYFNVTDPEGVFMLLTATSGAVANGIDENQATVSITDSNGPVSNVAVLFSISGTAIFSNKKNTIWVITNELGKATETFSSSTAGIFTIRATFNGEFRENTSFFVEDDSLPILTSHVINNEEPYGEEPILIRYELRNQRGQGITEAPITLSSTASEISFSNKTISTDANGTAVGLVYSSLPGTFIITAVYPHSKTVINNTAVSFKENANYYILANVVKNGAIANGEDYNEITFTVYDDNTNLPVNNQTLTVTISEKVTYQSPIYTSTNGYATLKATSQNSGSFDGTVVLLSDDSVTCSFTVEFVNVYPKLLSTKTLFCKDFVPINSYLSNNYLIAGHVYKLVFSRSDFKSLQCPENQSFGTAHDSAYCSISNTNAFQFYGDEITSFTVLTSGFADTLSSYRFTHYPDFMVGDITVELWDYGNNPDTTA